MSERNNREAVKSYLTRGLERPIEVRDAAGPAEVLFAPGDGAEGELHLGEGLCEGSDEEGVLERLRRDGVVDLLRRGERVKVTEIATEILPRG